MNGAAGRPHFGPMPSLQREITDFDADVLQRSQERFVLAEFWAAWCTAGPRVHPALERVAARNHGRLDLVSVNIEMHPEILDAQHVRGLPMVKAYCKGIAIGEMTGVLPETAIDRWVDSLFEAARQGGLLPPLPKLPTAALR